VQSTSAIQYLNSLPKQPIRQCRKPIYKLAAKVRLNRCYCLIKLKARHISPFSVKLLKNRKLTEQCRGRRSISNRRKGFCIKLPISLFIRSQRSRPNCSLRSTLTHPASPVLTTWSQRPRKLSSRGHSPSVVVSPGLRPNSTRNRP
jgi:hypothetical protein